MCITGASLEAHSGGKESACNMRDLGLIPGSGRSPGKGNGNPLHYSCLGNPMDREAWRAKVHGVAKNQTRLSDYHFHMGIIQSLCCRAETGTTL